MIHGYNDNFKRIGKGQIWIWSDPIFGAKHNQKGYLKTIPELEISTRYTRMVVTLSSFVAVRNDGPVYIAPITSSNHSVYDIPIILDRICYIQPQSVIPVSEKSLVEYVGTVSDTIIDNILMKLGEIMGMKGYCVNTLTTANNTNDNNDQITILNKWIQKCIKSKDIKLDISNIGVLFNHYIDFCKSKEYPVNKADIEGFRNSLIMLYPGLFANNLESSSKAVIEDIPVITAHQMNRAAAATIDAATRQGKSEQVLATVSATPDRVAKSITSSKWTPERKKEFIEDCKAEGSVTDEVAAKYNIKLETALKYFYAWRKNISSKNDRSTKKSEQVLATVSATPVVAETAPDDNEIDDILMEIRDFNSVTLRNTISRLTSIYTSYCEKMGMYQKIQEHHRIKVKDEEFYSKISASIFFSIINLLNIYIDNTSGNYYYPNVNENMRSIDSWMFIIDLSKDDLIYLYDNTKELYAAYCSVHGIDECGLEHTWINYLRNKLRSKFSKEISDEIVEMIGDSFTLSDEE